MKAFLRWEGEKGGKKRKKVFEPRKLVHLAKFD